MSLKSLSNESLHTQTIALACEERKITTEILHHLREISVRRLYAKLGYSSLWEYCIKELKYSEGSAQRRISAMKLLIEIPELEQKIKDGKITLSTVSQIQSACRNKPELKRNLLQSLEGKSKRHVEKVLAAVFPEQALPEKRRVLNERQIELRLIISDDLEDKLNRIKALLSHKKFNPSYAEVIEMMADLLIEKIDPEKKVKSPPPVAVKKAQAKPTRYVPVEIKRALYRRAGSRCEFINPLSMRRCEETKCLQIDHILEFARGGSNEVENLQLYCAAHNRLRAVESYGVEKMAEFFKRNTAEETRIL